MTWSIYGVNGVFITPLIEQASDHGWRCLSLDASTASLMLSLARLDNIEPW